MGQVYKILYRASNCVDISKLSPFHTIVSRNLGMYDNFSIVFGVVKSCLVLRVWNLPADFHAKTLHFERRAMEKVQIYQRIYH